jgi:CelD/BcsL family acetyltransferase involved in cellulose biosynthesis
MHSDVEVAVFEADGRWVGFWPYQRDARNVAHPVGLSLCDFQGVVVERSVEWSPLELLKACGLQAWCFDHVPASQLTMRQCGWLQVNSPIIDLTSGFDDYCRQRRLASSSTIRETLRKARKLEREIGPLRFVPHDTGPRMLATVIAWKRAQYRRIGSVDHLAAPWTRELLTRIAGCQSPEFSGMLSAVFAGPHLLGAHFGLRSRKVLHGWFPTFNREFERYSPGLVFWLTLAQHAGELGIERIDLGRGDERYKQSLKTGDVPLLEGAVDRGRLSRAVRKGRWVTKRMLLSSPIASPLRSVVRSARRLWRRPEAPEPCGPCFAAASGSDESIVHAMHETPDRDEVLADAGCCSADRSAIETHNT